MTDLATRKGAIRLTRTYKATLEEVWALWTTKDGIEAWWGPEGFAVTVQALDLKAGGELVYVMTATAAPQIEFMEKAGMPLATTARITFTEVKAPGHQTSARLAYATLADFIPGVPSYPVGTVVELEKVAEGVRMTVTSDAMHDDAWTANARAGFESQVERLGALLAGRA